MSNKITENTIEEFAIELLERLGYQYIYASDIAHDGERPERQSYEDVLLTERLQNAIQWLWGRATQWLWGRATLSV